MYMNGWLENSHVTRSITFLQVALLSFAWNDWGSEGGAGGGGSKHYTNSRNIDAKYHMNTFVDVLLLTIRVIDA